MNGSKAALLLAVIAIALGAYTLGRESVVNDCSKDKMAKVLSRQIVCVPFNKKAQIKIEKPDQPTEEKDIYIDDLVKM